MNLKHVLHGDTGYLDRTRNLRSEMAFELRQRLAYEREQSKLVVRREVALLRKTRWKENVME